MSQESNQKGEKKSFWGSTLSKLKSALSKTRAAVVDPVTGDSTAVIQSIAPATHEGSTIKTEPIGMATPETTAFTQENVSTIINRPLVIDDDYLEDLEDKLIRADLGLATVDTLMKHLRQHSKSKNWAHHDVQNFLKEEFSQILAAAPSHKLSIKDDQLNVILIVGVNGTGKTTSIGKLCNRLRSMNKKVLIAAGDTFRAAAESQLEIWAERSNCDLLRLPNGSDPGAVVYQAIKKAKDENYDILVIDTAGRLHNKANLMAELGKIQSVINKNADQANFEVLLVLDASTGQNGIQQARVFSETCPLTGVILTKLDGTAKGGVIFSIANELKIPVKLIGLGEKIDDLQDFQPELFIEALFE